MKKKSHVVDILVNGPVHLHAPYPPFDSKCINESAFERGLRCKEYNALLDLDKNRGDLEWLAQGLDELTESFTQEVIRAFKANGAQPGTIIYVDYGIRDNGLTHSTQLTVN